MCFCASGIKKGNFYMIRLVASDIDGTLLQGGASAFGRAVRPYPGVEEARGILFCAASGGSTAACRGAEDDIAYLCENRAGTGAGAWCR